ncbi:MAG: DnaD domain protein [Bacillota bacterium]
MSFYKTQQSLDLGEVPIESIFINDFMPTANGTYVKVYLLGYKFANDLTDVDNVSLAKHLNISLEDVINAWEFWENKNIIKIHNRESQSDNFDVEFLSLRQLYIDNNYSNKVSSSKADKNKYTRNVDVLLEMEKQDAVREMFKTLSDTIRRELQPNEKLKVLNVIERYNMDLKVIIQAFKFSVEKKNKKNLNYILAIIRNWYDEGIVTFKDLENHFLKNNKRYNIYKKIYRSLGYSKSLVSSGDKELIDTWIDKYNLEIDFILEIIKFASKKTSNINMNYINHFIKKAYKENYTEISDFTKNKEKSSKNNKNNKNKFHNFQKNENNYTKEELDKILGIRE